MLSRRQMLSLWPEFFSNWFLKLSYPVLDFLRFKFYWIHGIINCVLWFLRNFYSHYSWQLTLLLPWCPWMLIVDTPIVYIISSFAIWTSWFVYEMNGVTLLMELLGMNFVDGFVYGTLISIMACEMMYTFLYGFYKVWLILSNNLALRFVRIWYPRSVKMHFWIILTYKKMDKTINPGVQSFFVL